MTKILIVGEAWGEHEDKHKTAFVGPSGRLLNGLLKQVGFRAAPYITVSGDDIPDWSRSEFFVTNVFNLRPRPTNDIKNLGVPKKEGLGQYPALGSGKYIPKSLEGEIDRLHREIEMVNPNLILALGGVPLGVLMRAKIPIGKNRGNLFQTPGGRKLLATYHPAAVLREWTLRPILIADLTKAMRHAQTSAFSRPRREIWVEPTLADLNRFHNRYMLDVEAPCGVDIETSRGTITEIGFAPTTSVAIVIPFYSRSTPNGNYWSTTGEEVEAWNWVADRCHELRHPVFQNGLYDLNYLLRMGISVTNANEDTMLLHHALQPEMEKGLGRLGSVYTDEPSWKMMRQDQDTLKGEDE